MRTLILPQGVSTVEMAIMHRLLASTEFAPPIELDSVVYSTMHKCDIA